MTMINPEAKLQFIKAAEVHGLDPESRERAWNRMVALGVTPDDPLSITMAVSVVLENAAEAVPKALASLPGQIADATTQSSEIVANAVSRRLLRANFATTFGKRIGQAATDHFNSAEHLRRLRVSSVMVTCACALFVGATAIGFHFGEIDRARTNAEWSELINRADAASWLRLANLNPAVERALATCTSGANSFRENGSLACRLPLWLEEPPSPNAMFAEAERLFNIRAWLAWPPFWMAALGFSVGTFGRKLIRKVSKSQAIKWIFDA
jgi:hypothetical protein